MNNNVNYELIESLIEKTKRAMDTENARYTVKNYTKLAKFEHLVSEVNRLADWRNGELQWELCFGDGILRIRIEQDGEPGIWNEIIDVSTYGRNIKTAIDAARKICDYDLVAVEFDKDNENAPYAIMEFVVAECYKN